MVTICYHDSPAYECEDKSEKSARKQQYLSRVELRSQTMQSTKSGKDKQHTATAQYADDESGTCYMSMSQHQCLNVNATASQRLCHKLVVIVIFSLVLGKI